MQHPLAEEIQLRTSIALPLQEFQFGDLALDLPVTVGQLERCLHRGVFALSTIGAVHELWHLTREAVREPRVKSCGCPLKNHLANALDHRRGRLKPLVVTSRLEELLVGWRQRLLWT
jgi:hypothetical protein